MIPFMVTAMLCCVASDEDGFVASYRDGFVWCVCGCICWQLLCASAGDIFCLFCIDGDDNELHWMAIAIDSGIE